MTKTIVFILRITLSLLTTAGLSFAQAADTDDDTPLARNLSQEYLLDRYATPASNFAYLNHTMVHYRDEGRGPAILLIHGSLQTLYDWDGWMEALTLSYRVIRLDLPAAGLTGRVQSGDYSIDSTMRTIDQLMDKLGEEQFAVVGTSLGGVFAFRYAASRRDRVAALVLMNSAGVAMGNEKIIPPQEQRYNESLATTIKRADMITILNAVIPDPSKLPPGRVDQGLDYQRREGREAESTALVAAYQSDHPDQVLGRITAPTQVLWGSDNKALSPSVADQFVAMLSCSPAVEKALIPGTGHWPHVEAPTRSVRFVEAFLARHYGPDAQASTPACG